VLNQEKIVKIAREAANHRGYTVYDDYNEALRHEICHERLIEPTHAGWYLFTIKRTMINAGWRFEKHRPARFYPPTQSSGSK
jgi:hypothetical protein